MSLAAQDVVLDEIRDGVLLVTLNRPDRLNAWTPRMSEELISAIERANADPAIRRAAPL